MVLGLPLRSASVFEAAGASRRSPRGSGSLGCGVREQERTSLTVGWTPPQCPHLIAGIEGEIRWQL